jgi:hypothetical protein
MASPPPADTAPPPPAGAAGVGAGGGGPLFDIRVKTLAPATYTVPVRATATGAQLKDAVAGLVGTPVPRQRLIWRGRVISDFEVLGQLGEPLPPPPQIPPQPYEASLLAMPLPHGAAMQGCMTPAMCRFPHHSMHCTPRLPSLL